MNHNLYMQRCLELAKNGLGSTYPNPMVGCVVVCDDEIIGEGWHRQAGEPHAEVMAINHVKDHNKLSQSTIYVSLEPCSHFGKTPPCSDLILAKNIPNVVVGCGDPFAKVAGRGIKKLADAGRNVVVGVLENECIALNKRFFTFHNKKRPYIILKWAETADGFIAPLSKNDQQPFWISNEKSRQLVHKWRSEEQAILVGHHTVLVDNPRLTVRDWSGDNPLRVVLSEGIDKQENYAVFDHQAPTLVVDCKKTVVDLLDHLFLQNIQSVIVEGGKKTLDKFISANLWDEARVFQSNDYLYQGIDRPSIKGQMLSVQPIDDNRLTILIP